ncbi:hypothetical protein KP509_04G006400 [Ceratopteris richardii]|uniref:RRM domain-containing protein n=1 Tax=Ceratopteris richardii TaxID=49495 RepID=A0A8T2UXC2_CERRI|nr:hypothetical protein KP509_04G006400 [Ceratopteris richardii]
MASLAMVDCRRLWATADISPPRIRSELVQSQARLADLWSIAHSVPLGSRGVNHKELPKTFGSKQGGQTQRTEKAQKNLATEEDLQYKPRGFGEGKDYDTSLEDKLLEEIEHEKEARVAALHKRRKNATAIKSSTSKSTSQQKATVDGIKVWVGDLPKKKNIDRDLWAAFKHVPGLIDISPSVIGNEKTRDPICKGFGIFTFNTIEHAQSFISSFQSQPVSFGRIKKKLSLKLLKVGGAKPVLSKEGSSADPGKLRIREKDAGLLSNSVSTPISAAIPNIDQEIASRKDADETVHSEIYQSDEESIETGEFIGMLEYDTEYSSEVDSDDDFDTDDEAEINVSVEYENDSAENIITDETDETENNDIDYEAEKRIEELEKRIIAKLEAAGYGIGKGKHKEKKSKPTGFGSKGSRGSKQSRVNNLVAVTHGLKKKERALMTGVLEKYGKSSSTSN